MRAAVFETFGGPEVLQIREVPRPSPGPGQVLVAVFASGANPVDAQNRQGGDWTLPAIPGSDISGVVEALGMGVSDLAPGDEVFYMADFLEAPGGCAEYHVVDASLVERKPHTLSHVEAASIPLAAGTAYQAIGERMQVQSEEWLLVNGAAGGVGSYAVQVGKALGARVLAAASAGRAQYLRELGADAVIDYRTEDVPSRAAEIAGGSLDAVLDLVGGRFIESALPFVRQSGRIAAVVDLKGDIDPVLDRNVTLHGILVRPSRRLLRSLQELIVHGDLKPVVNAVSPLSEVRAVHQRLDQRHGQGKAVIAMPILTEGEA